jgi:CRISPR-associated protein Csb1
MTDIAKLLVADGPAGLAVTEHLLPINKDDTYIRPAIFAANDVANKDEYKNRWGVYNITDLGDGGNVITIDTVGSQANRIEPIFLQKPYRQLVRQVIIVRKANGKSNGKGTEAVEHNLLERPHRAADVIARFSDLKVRFDEAMRAYLKGDSRPLLKLAPTSLLFGFDDRRGTKAKQGRVISSRIDATNAHQAGEYTQYTGVAAAADDADEQKYMSEVGWTAVPSYRPAAGVYVKGHIVRYCSLSLSCLRSLGPAGAEGEKARQYALGLALVAFTAPIEYALRSGCYLRRDSSRPPVYTIATLDKGDLPLNLTHEEALAFANKAAQAFGVDPDLRGEFSDKAMRAELEEMKLEAEAKKTKAKAKKAAQAVARST